MLGRRITLDNESYTITGVMPRDFHFPSRRAALWTATRFKEEDFQERDNNYLEGVARLRPGVTVAAARAELGVIMTRLERQYPKELQRTGSNVIRLRDELTEQSRLMLIALSGAAACVLSIACANLANLLLARGLGRAKELAMRAALGAGRERLVRQMATESMVLALMGGAVGVLVSLAAIPLLARLVPGSLPIAQTPSVDLRVLAFAALVTGVTGIGFGVLPALRACPGGDLTALREGARSGGGRKEHLRSALVIGEVMASVVLLVSAGLLCARCGESRAPTPASAPRVS